MELMILAELFDIMRQKYETIAASLIKTSRDAIILIYADEDGFKTSRLGTVVDCT